MQSPVQAFFPITESPNWGCPTEATSEQMDKWFPVGVIEKAQPASCNPESLVLFDLTWEFQLRKSVASTILMEPLEVLIPGSTFAVVSNVAFDIFRVSDTYGSKMLPQRRDRKWKINRLNNCVWFRSF
jgi:hypothetical protein